jgi:ribulose-phosphate 3-epimerase
MIEIIPAVIPDTLDVIREKFALVKGVAQKVQVDFVDGKYAPPVSWPFNIEGDFTQEKFPFIEELKIEADLFVQEPKEFLEKLIKIGFKDFVIHLDSVDSVQEFSECLELAKSAGGEVGIGVKPSGDLDKLELFLNQCNFVQFMGNDNVGRNHVELDESVLEKIKNFHAAHPEMPIQIDIGVNFDTAHKIKEAGVTRLVSGSAVFESELPISQAIEKLINA